MLGKTGKGRSTSTRSKAVLHTRWVAMFLHHVAKYLPWTRDLRIRIIVWSRQLAFPLRFLPGNSKVFGPPRKLHFSPNDTPGCVVTELSAGHTASQSAPITNSQLVKAAFRALPSPNVAPRYVARISHARYFGQNGGSVVAQDDGLVWTLSPTNYTYELPLHHAFCRILLTPPRKYNLVIHLATRLAKQYYWHWMMDCVTRFRLLREAGINQNNILDAMWIIDHSHLPFQLETLSALGIHQKAVLVSRRYLHIQAETLIVPSYTNPAADATTVTYSHRDVDFLRQLFLPPAIPDPMLHMERIYLSRRGPRCITNEREVISFLKNRGFSILHCEDLPVWRQAQIFSTARMVIGIHGGALTNILFCTPGTTIIEIMSPDYISPFYWRLSTLSKLHHFVYCEDAHFRGVTGWRFKNTMPVTINVKGFERFYDEVLGSSAIN
jgi:Glycosyltransferase 61